MNMYSLENEGQPPQEDPSSFLGNIAECFGEASGHSTIFLTFIVRIYKVTINRYL